jgi:XTP/dITP diphosphohydrolase
VVFETEAAIDGVIASGPAGMHGFGYDPIFYYAPLQKTTAELTIDEKCIVSHRARAFRDFARWLRHSQLS